MVKPASKKNIVKHFKKTYQLSERTSCDLVGISRTGFRYQAKPKGDQAFKKRLLELATKHPSYGYLFLHGLMKSEGLACNKKRTYRIYTELGLQVRTKKRKKLIRPRMPMFVPNRPDVRWSMDFVSDQLANGRRFRVLNVIDDFTREMVGQLTAFSISGRQVGRFLSELTETRGKPDQVVCDNGLPSMSIKKAPNPPIFSL